jgi:hypothetical protein
VRFGGRSIGHTKAEHRMSRNYLEGREATASHRVHLD